MQTTRNTPNTWSASVGRKLSPATNAMFLSNAGLYTPQRVVASLAHQPKTKKFVDEAFGVSLDNLAAGSLIAEILAITKALQ